ncbi:hypothetical protein BOX15_Mlig033900g2 [Macrostomum lignano]|uniref:Uncharacterized protein n=1 Tax=Macrostomum lignano TaxID=282301 RepID=A0A267G7K0_9PLAT|nr:hypothetical protein BOX15_Mlig033900g2 [Macrostomum lignano]
MVSYFLLKLVVALLLLLAPLVLLVNVISFVRGGLYCQEINFYLNRTTENSTSSNCSEIFIGYNAGTISTLVMLVVCFQLGYLNSKNGHISARFYSGVFLLLLCRVALIAWNCWAAMEDDLLPPNPQMVHNVYATASALDGISNALALVAGYELMYRVAPAGSKNLVMGFLFTIWAVGTSIAGVTILSMMEIPYNQPILKPVWGKSNNLWVSYVVMVVETVFLLLYYGCVSTKIAARMLEFDDYCSEEASECDSENDSRELNGLDYQRYVSSANGDEVDEAPERSSNSL